jgi:UDP-N-acetylmuramyl pentapeptide phosphotransferase/UDP-N-acetylglucosamine-1-phosphate transferase
MKLLCIFISFVLAFIIGQIMVLRTYLFAYRRHLFDPVESRKVHRGLIPRLGGLVFLPAQCGVFMLLVVVMRHFEIIPIDYALLIRFLFLICGLGLLFVVGMLDDLMGIGYRWKFVVQLAAVSFLPISGLWIENLGGLMGIHELSPWVGIPLTILAGVFIINSFNLIDGIDGICAGVTMMACTVLGTLFLMKEMWLHVIFAFITIGVLSPFFYYNVFGKSKKKRRIFMGDTGSLTLGFSVTFLVISYAVDTPDVLPVGISGNIIKAFSVIMVPVLDVVRVMLIRLLSHKPLFMPDNNHVHHYLMRLGIGRHATLVYMLVVGALFIIFNTYMVRYMNGNLVVLSDLVLWFVGLWLCGKYRTKKKQLNDEKK